MKHKGVPQKRSLVGCAVYNQRATAFRTVQKPSQHQRRYVRRECKPRARARSFMAPAQTPRLACMHAPRTAPRPQPRGAVATQPITLHHNEFATSTDRTPPTTRRTRPPESRLHLWRRSSLNIHPPPLNAPKCHGRRAVRRTPIQGGVCRALIGPSAPSTVRTTCPAHPLDSGGPAMTQWR